MTASDPVKVWADNSYYSNKIEEVEIDRDRALMVSTGDKKPETPDENMILGYIKALQHIDAERPELTVDSVHYIHSLLFTDVDIEKGKWKNEDNEIRITDYEVVHQPVPAAETADYMERLVSSFNKHWDEKRFDPLILIPMFIFDFLCIHPYKEGCGRIARLLMRNLLLQSGFETGKEVSLEKEIYETKGQFFDSLKLSSARWYEGQHDINPWLEYFYTILERANSKEI